MTQANHTSLFIMEDDLLVFKSKSEPLRSLFVTFLVSFDSSCRYLFDDAGYVK